MNQVGFATNDTKVAYLMSGVNEAGASFDVSDMPCHSVFHGTIGPDLGSWNTNYPHVYALDFSTLTQTGSYTIQVSGAEGAASPRFQIGAGNTLYAPLVDHALSFYQAQRDGPNTIPGPLGRLPSHLDDQHAAIYSQPSYHDDELTAAPNRIGTSTVDVSGGWFDAGDYLKFVETTSYVEAVMLIAVRDHQLTNFQAEARYGIEWLLRMWNDSTQTLIYQVGIGDGSSALNIAGDHDFWRLPEADDALQVTATDSNYYVRYRPAFREAAAGSQVSPNLAGRLAADFALCSQVFRATDVTLANTCLLAAEHVFALARTTSAHPSLITVSPSDYYPESSWRDDMELGATELYYAVAGVGTAPANLPVTNPNTYLTQAGTWADAFLSSSEDGSDSLNLYDVSALAHDELVKAIRVAHPTGLAVTEQDLLADMHDQLDAAVQAGHHDPYSLASSYSNGDAMPHALGLAVTASLYEELSGDTSFKAFGLHQRDTVLGANPWGTSFIVGAGTTFPHCIHHQIANLSGALDGTSPLLLGAVLDGPADPGELAGLSLDPNDGHRTCPAAGGDLFAGFASADVAYKDDVADYPSVEPALDYSALSILLFARQ